MTRITSVSSTAFRLRKVLTRFVDVVASGLASHADRQGALLNIFLPIWLLRSSDSQDTRDGAGTFDLCSDSFVWNRQKILNEAVAERPLESNFAH
jgi:hypothetical protein